MPCDKMDDVIAFAQLEEAVDHAAQAAPARGGSDLADETARRWRPARCRSLTSRKPACKPADRESASLPAAASLVAPKISRRRSTSASVGQTMIHVVAQADGVELVAHFGDVAAEALDAFDPQLAVDFHRAAGHRRGRDRGKAINRWPAHRRDRERLAADPTAADNAGPSSCISCGSTSRNQLPAGDSWRNGRERPRRRRAP